MKNQKRSREELEAELRAIKRYQTANVISATVVELFKWLGLTAIAGLGYLTIDSLAGKTTSANIGLDLLANVELSKGAAWLLAVLSTGYGLRQKKLRKSTIERLQGRILTLESAIDPNRTSSGLTPTGETPPKDTWR